MHICIQYTPWETNLCVRPFSIQLHSCVLGSLLSLPRVAQVEQDICNVLFIYAEGNFKYCRGECISLSSLKIYMFSNSNMPSLCILCVNYLVRLQSPLKFNKFLSCNDKCVLASVPTWFLSLFRIGSSHHRFNVPHRIAASLDEVKSTSNLLWLLN